MNAAAPPLRFLLLVAGGWICIRAAILGADLWVRPGTAAPAPLAAPAPVASAVPAVPLLPEATAAPFPMFPLRPESQPVPLAPVAIASVAAPLASPAPASAAPPSFGIGPLGLVPIPPPPEGSRSRWSASAWLFVRPEGGGGALAPGGSLGGSQAGLRLLYRLADRPPLALSGRVSAPLEDFGGAEAALGIDWRPLPDLPIHLLAERRQRLGARGRSAFAFTVYGGVSDRRPAGPLRLDAYGLAGLVGARSRDPFVDGGAQLTVPVAGVNLGGGAWGAAQPGAARLDVGPHAFVTIPVAEGRRLRLSADWRFRIAGDAAPSSGPALTLSSDF